MKNNLIFARKIYHWIGRPESAWRAYQCIENRIYALNYALTIGRRQSGRLLALKDTHSGERCFIIGNGPSLKKHDLTKLTAEKTLATNMFLLHPNLKKFNLDYFCASDPVHWRVNDGFPTAWYDAFSILKDTTFFFEKSCLPVSQKIPELANRRVFFLNLDLGSHVFEGHFSTNIEKKVCWGRSVIIDFCLPITYFLGFSEVYLIGCDYDYKLDKSKTYDNAYFYDRAKDEREEVKGTGSSLHIKQVFASLKVVKQFFESYGRKIYNAGYGGKLEVFERVDYDALF